MALIHDKRISNFSFQNVVSLLQQDARNYESTINARQ